MSDQWKDGTKVRFKSYFSDRGSSYREIHTVSSYNPEFNNVIVDGMGRFHVNHLILEESKATVKRSDVQKYLDQNSDLPLDKVVKILRDFDVEIIEDVIEVEVGYIIEWPERFLIPNLPVNAVLRSFESVVYDRWPKGWYSAGPEAKHFPKDTDFEDIEGEFPFIILYLPEEL